MADTVVEFAEVMAETGNTRTRGGFIKKTFENIADMLNVVPFLNLHHKKDYWMMMTFSISKDIQEDNERIVFDEEEFETIPSDDSQKELFNSSLAMLESGGAAQLGERGVWRPAVVRRPSPSLADLTRQRISGLYYLHRRKIVHRDIKPSEFYLGMFPFNSGR
nr:mitogen-activated protein kinase kinase 5-like [Ipomoea batatas]